MIYGRKTGRLIVAILLVFFIGGTFAAYGAHSIDEGKDPFLLPYGLAFWDKDSKLIISDTKNHRILSYDVKTKKITNLAGLTKGQDRFGFPGGGYVDGPVSMAMFNHPRGVAVADNGTILVADTNNHAIRQIRGGQVTTLAGGKIAGFKDGLGTQASFLSPGAIALDDKGIIYVSDTLNNAIRKIDDKGNVSTLYQGDDLEEPMGLAVDKEGYIYIAVGGSQQIKKLSPDGVLSQVAGSASDLDEESGYLLGGYRDGKAKDAAFSFPKDLVIKDDGTLLVADTLNHLIRGIKDEEVFTVAGTNSVGDYFTDRFISFFNEPSALAYGDSTLFVADRQNNRIVAIPDNQDSLSKAMAKVKKQDEVVIFLDGEEVVISDDKPFVTKDDELMIPLRSLGEKWGGKVGWDNVNRKVTIEKNSKVLELFFSKGDFVLAKGRAFASFEIITEKLGMDIKSMAGGEIIIIEAK